MTENDIIKTKKDIPNIDGFIIPTGTEGTVLLVYSIGIPVYEVEFIINGKSYVETLTSNDIE